MWLSNEFKNPHFFEIPSLDKSSHLDEVYSKESHRLYEALHVNEMNSEIVNILRSIEIIKFFNDQKNRESEIKALNIEWLLNDFTNYN